MARKKTNLIYYDSNGNAHDVTKQKNTNKLFIKDTNIELNMSQVSKKKQKLSKKKYDYSKPSFAQNLGSEWDDYPWSADDF